MGRVVEANLKSEISALCEIVLDVTANFFEDQQVRDSKSNAASLVSTLRPEARC
jgi:hypothetical protein